MHAKIPKTRFNELANAEYGALYLLNESKNTKVPSSGKMSSPIGGKCFSILTKNARKRNTNLRKKVSRLQFSRNPKLNIDGTTPQSNWFEDKIITFSFIHRWYKITQIIICHPTWNLYFDSIISGLFSFYSPTMCDNTNITQICVFNFWIFDIGKWIKIYWNLIMKLLHSDVSSLKINCWKLLNLWQTCTQLVHTYIV